MGKSTISTGPVSRTMLLCQRVCVYIMYVCVYVYIWVNYCDLASERWNHGRIFSRFAVFRCATWKMGGRTFQVSEILFGDVWLVVSNMNFIFHSIWDVILPIDELIFFRGVIAPPTSYDLSQKECL